MENNACRLILPRIKTEFSRGVDPVKALAVARAMFERQLQADKTYTYRRDVGNLVDTVTLMTPLQK